MTKLCNVVSAANKSLKMLTLGRGNSKSKLITFLVGHGHSKLINQLVNTRNRGKHLMLDLEMN